MYLCVTAYLLEGYRFRKADVHFICEYTVLQNILSDHYSYMNITPSCDCAMCMLLHLILLLALACGMVMSAFSLSMAS